MITPLKASEKQSAAFVVADIETYAKPHPREGEVIDIDVCWREKMPGLFGEVGEIQHKHFGEWLSFWNWLVSKARIDKRFRRVFAHNGGGFDWVCLAEWLLTAGSTYVDSLSNVQAGSKMIVLMATIEKRFTIRFADSLPILRGSLDELAGKLLGKSKIDLGGRMPHEVKESDPVLYERYCSQDTELLLEILEKTLDIIREHVAPIKDLGYTIGSTSMKVFRTIGVDAPISIPWEPELKAFLRAGFAGGRVEVFQRGYFPNVNVYDINSLYPSIMREALLPTSERGYWIVPGFDKEISPVGVYEIEFDQSPESGFAVLMQNGVGSYSGSGVYFGPEIILLKEIDPNVTIKVMRGFVFSDVARIFLAFVDKLYSLRLKDKKGPLGEITKYLLNSNYGKWAQKSERSKLVVVRDVMEICKHVRAEYAKPKGKNKRAVDMLAADPFASIDPDPFALSADHKGMRLVNPELGVFEVNDEIKCEHEHVGIAGLITANARCALYRGFMLAGFSRVVYCDTDSVHCLSTLPHSVIDNDRLGAFKHEHTGEGVYAGKKLYALRVRNTTGERVEKVRAKGVSVQSRRAGKIINPNGHPLGFDDLLRICNGESVDCRFTQPPTHLEVFSGSRKAGVWQERKRTIKCT